MRTVTGVPNYVKRFRIATRICSSATWRSNSLAMTRSPSDIKQRIFVSTRLRLVITKPLFPDHPTQTLCTAQNLVAHKRRLDSIIGTVPYMHLNPLSATLVLVGYPGNLEQPVLNTAPMVLGRSRWLAERRHYRDPGAARFFWATRHYFECGSDQDAEDQRRVRAHAQELREVPLRDRHGVAEGLRALAST